MTIPLISPAQTDANSPLNETLLEGLRQRSTYMPLGSIIWLYRFNELIAPPEGYMPCTGLTVTEANYNSIHGAGKWAAQIGTSPLAGRYLPNLNNRYMIGSESTQDGYTDISAVGNASHLVDVSHAHTVNSHNHQVYSSKGNNATDKIYNSAGNEVDPSEVTKGLSVGIAVKLFTRLYQLATRPTSFDNGSVTTLPNWYTKSNTSTTTTNGDTALDIKPESIAAEPWIRII